MEFLPERVRLVAAPGALRDVELAVLGWRTEDGQTALICRRGGRLSGRWARSARRTRGGCWRSGLGRCGSAVRAEHEPLAKTEVLMRGQLALVTGETVAAAAVWETLSPEAQRAVITTLARLAARLLEAGRDE